MEQVTQTSPTPREIADLVIAHVLQAKMRLGLTERTPITVGFVTETIEGVLPQAIQLYGYDILESVSAITSRWDPAAPRATANVAGEELIISLSAV